MAITGITASGGLTVNIGFTDKTNKTATTRVNLPASATLPQAEAYALALLQALEVLSDCLISSCSISVGYAVAGANAAVAAGNYAEDKGQFSFQTAAGKTSLISIPGVKETMRSAGARTINTADAAITTFTDLVVTGDGTLAPVDSNGEDLTQLLYARVRQRRELGT
jgi:hypothetical protein